MSGGAFGPWGLSRELHGLYVTTDNGRRCVAMVPPMSDRAQEVANLIAAAPALVEALKYTCASLCLDDFGDWYLPKGFDEEKLFSALRAAGVEP